MAFEPQSGTKRKLTPQNEEDVDLIEEQLNPSKRSTGFSRPKHNDDIPFDLNPDPDSSSDSQYEFTFYDDEQEDDQHYIPIQEDLNNIKVIHKTKKQTKMESINENDADDDEDVDVINNFVNDDDNKNNDDSDDDDDDDLMNNQQTKKVTFNNNHNDEKQNYPSGIQHTGIDLNWSEDDAIEPYESDANTNDNENDNDDDKKNDDDNKQIAWFPTQKVNNNEEMKYDKSAYNVLFEFYTEWPCLSFDIISDNLGAIRTTVPFSMYLVCGSQADANYRKEVTNKSKQKNKNNVRIQNKIQFLKVNEIQKTKYDDDVDDLNEENDPESTNFTTDDPKLQNRDINHSGIVNRIRTKKCNNKHFVATYSDDCNVNIYDGTQHVLSLDGLSTNLDLINENVSPLYKSLNNDEGFGLSWSIIGNEPILLSGSCVGELKLYKPRNSTFIRTLQFKTLKSSIEDIAWSPQHKDIFITVGVDKCIRLWDIRNNKKEHIARINNAHKNDINVCSWNPHCGHDHLLLTGSDDHSFKIWDLRKLQSGSRYNKKLKKCSHYYLSSWHIGPITSIEWHPNDSSSAVVSSEDNQISVWDFSLENDASIKNNGAKLPNDILNKLPPQLTFLHGGQTDIKEVHFHKQIPNMLISTAGNGFHIFQPDNLMESFRKEFSSMSIVN